MPFGFRQIPHRLALPPRALEYPAFSSRLERIMARDLYETLGVARGASEADIKKAYRKLARAVPPRPQPRRQAGRGPLQGNPERLRRPRRQAEARELRPLRHGRAGRLRRRRQPVRPRRGRRRGRRQPVRQRQPGRPQRPPPPVRRRAAAVCTSTRRSCSAVGRAAGRAARPGRRPRSRLTRRSPSRWRRRAAGSPSASTAARSK